MAPSLKPFGASPCARQGEGLPLTASIWEVCLCHQVVMDTCSSLTLLGHTVVCTIHQPRTDIYRLFNEVMYMVRR